MDKFKLILLLSVILSGISQLLLKRGSLEDSERKYAEYLNIFTFCGYLLLLGVTIINFIIFKHIQMSGIVFFMPITYVVIAIFSKYIFNEVLSVQKIVGSLMILVGIIAYYI